MRTATFRFARGRNYVTTGMCAKKQEGKCVVDAYLHQERSVSIHYYPKNIPRFCKKPGSGESGQLYLDRLTFVLAPSGILYACEEVDSFDDVLLFFDTYDPDEKVECFGKCIRPMHDRESLPFFEAKSLADQGDYGLVVLRPGESILLQSSAFSAVRLEYSARGVFRTHECTQFELEALSCVKTNS